MKPYYLASERAAAHQQRVLHRTSADPHVVPLGWHP